MSTQTMILIILPLAILQVALQVYALYDIWKNRNAFYNIWIWVVVVLVFTWLGAIIYFVFGRKEYGA
jgi:hypothetical protein